ncbi:ANTAR domain-containing protein [Streptomyces sp. NPDC050504]|uniref:ANTAR domain-containing protein n=1 Tax=Streptomyces sp. NPDC050504 TaxID=3365618 RepID=UPI00379AC3D9
MPGHEDLPGCLARLHRAVLAGQDLSAAPAAALAPLLDLQALTLSLRSARGDLELLWFDPANPLGPALDDLQTTLGEGPNWDALRTGRTITVPDLATEPQARWPAFTPAAARTPARAVITTPLRMGVATPGILTGYRTDPGPFPPGQRHDINRFARIALDLLLHTTPASLDLHRAEVHQAAGYLSVRLHLSVDQALLRLRAHAWHHNRTLRDVARDILAGRLSLEN